MESSHRARLLYAILAVGTVGLGLASRAYGARLPLLVSTYAGDTLWALMVYLGLGVVMPSASIRKRAAIALASSYAIELSQLYHAPWIDAIRHTRLGGLVLGFGFLWSDVVCYTVGVAIGAVSERVVLTAINRASAVTLCVMLCMGLGATSCAPPGIDCVGPDSTVQEIHQPLKWPGPVSADELAGLAYRAEIVSYGVVGRSAHAFRQTADVAMKAFDGWLVGADRGEWGGEKELAT